MLFYNGSCLMLSHVMPLMLKSKYTYTLISESKYNEYTTAVVIVWTVCILHVVVWISDGGMRWPYLLSFLNSSLPRNYK